jgi:hypothetical protein
MRESTIESLIEAARSRWGQGRFLTGDCHILAMALHEATGRVGTLRACVQNADGPWVSYRHMVLVMPDGQSWDISGSNAVSRWDTREKTTASRPEWVDVPSAHEDYADTGRWLGAMNGRRNTTLRKKLTALFQSRKHSPVL